MLKKNLCIFFVLVCFVYCVGCTFHLKSKELEMDSKPSDSSLKWSSYTNKTYVLESIDFLKDAGS